MVNPGGTGTPSFIISASNAPLLYWMRGEERERESIGQHTSRVFFLPSSFSSIDRSVAQEEEEEEEKEEDFLASFFSIFFLKLMTSKNVSTGEFVSELKYVSTFLTDPNRQNEQRTHLFPRISFNSALPSQVFELKMYTTFGSPFGFKICIGTETFAMVVTSREVEEARN